MNTDIEEAPFTPIPTVEATASGTESLFLYTLGPVRTGTISYYLSPTFAGIETPTNTETLTIGSLSESCHGVNELTQSCTGPLIVNTPLATLPFTLGQYFTLSETFYADAFGYTVGGGGEGGIGGLQFNFQLFDATGAPVQVFVATPEPPTGLPIAVGGLALSLWKRRATQL